ncbi:MAG: FHA domain-containing protein [Verrucomicrobia bacterium]|nr:FHA domain-containing protein [Verrucomicrobiota bacterium]
MARLVLLTEGLTGRAYDLKVDRTTVGRLDDNAFQVAEASVSSHHCEVLLHGNDVVVKDLGSTNGTFVNGERITEATLKPGQILRLGSVEMRLESEAGAAPTKKPLSQTRPTAQGVKLGELDTGTRPIVFEKDSVFKKKSNKANLVFIIVGVVLAAVIIALIVVSIIKIQNP